MKVLYFLIGFVDIFWRAVVAFVFCTFGFLPLLVIAVFILMVESKYIPVPVLNALEKVAKWLELLTKVRVMVIIARISKKI